MHYNTGRNKSIVKSSGIAMNQIQIISASKRGTRTKHRPHTCSIHFDKGALLYAITFEHT